MEANDMDKKIFKKLKAWWLQCSEKEKKLMKKTFFGILCVVAMRYMYEVGKFIGEMLYYIGL